MPEISIIVPVYQVEKYIEECLNSIQTQTFKDFEVLLIDDGSTDGSTDICKAFAAMDKRFLYVRQNNQGVSNARNKGLSLAQGKYVYFIDADDVVSPDFVQHMFEYAKKHQLDLVINLSVLLNLSPKEEFIIPNLEPGIFTSTPQNYFHNGFLWNKLFKKELIDKANIRFIEKSRYREDEAFILMFYPFCKTHGIIRHGYYFYRQREDSAMHSVQKKLRKYEKSIQYNIENTLKFYKQYDFRDYIPLLCDLLPFYHEWSSPKNYWQFIKQINMANFFLKYKRNIHPFIFSALTSHGYIHFRIKMFWLYHKGFIKAAKKKFRTFVKNAFKR